MSKVQLETGKKPLKTLNSFSSIVW